MKKVAMLAALCLAAVSCQPKESADEMIDRVISVAAQQTKMLVQDLEPGIFPRTLNEDGSIKFAKKDWWCSGFLPGTLWKLYGATGDEYFLDKATAWTESLSDLVNMDIHHDIGFMVNCSYGNGYLATGKEEYKDMVVKGAYKLAGRFNPVVGCTKSWPGDDYKVIIDNMMNLEILMVGAEYSSDSTLSEIAKTHANTTMKNHFRDDYSTWHVLFYDPETGAVIQKKTHQGYSDDSAWARGQAWGLYGYTMMYRFSKDPAYLEQAKHIADYIIGRLPEDLVPFWDYDSPDIPNDVRDASAAALNASALLELSTYVDEANAKKYFNVAENTLRELSSERYLAEPGTNGGFILMHSTGSKPANSEVDVPLSYADYYFIEALLRYKDLLK